MDACVTILLMFVLGFTDRYFSFFYMNERIFYAILFLIWRQGFSLQRRRNQ